MDVKELVNRAKSGDTAAIARFIWNITTSCTFSA